MFMRTCVLALSLCSTLLSPLYAQAAPRYKVSYLPDSFSPIDINNAGLVAGDVQLGPGSLQRHAALLVRGKIVDLGTLGGTLSSATAINETGQVTGFSDTRGAASQHAFLYSRGKMIDIDGRGPGTGSVGYGINNKGQVVGGFVNQAGQSRAFLYSGRGLRDLGTLGGTISFALDINDAGYVVGESEIPDPTTNFPGTRPFVYRNGVMRPLGVVQDTPRTSHGAYEINNAGQIAAYSELSGAFHLFLYERGMRTDLGYFGSPLLQIRDMNERGAIVGYADSPGGRLAYLYDGRQLRDLNTLLTLPPGWRMLDATGINDHGQIVGTVCNENGCRPVRLDPIRKHPQAAEAGHRAGP